MSQPATGQHWFCWVNTSILLTKICVTLQRSHEYVSLLTKQVVDLERDREELHDIARKDKNIIHDQNVRIRELQLSEKNLKEQINQYDVSERSLYNKVEALEDHISKMEDRISELQVISKILLN